MAYGTVSLSRLENSYKTKPNKKLSFAIKIVDKYDLSISTIIFLNDSINVAIEVIATIIGYKAAIYSGKDAGFAEGFAGLIASFIALLILITFGEIIPKSLGKIHNYKLVRLYSPIIYILNYVFLPITFIVSKLGEFLTKPLTDRMEDIKISDDELHEMVDSIEEEGLVDESKAEIIRGTIDYANKEAYEVMTPRVDMYALDFSSSIDDVLSHKETLEYSRIPIYKDSIDNIVGFVLTKELVKMKILGRGNDSIAAIVNPVMTFPRSTEINDIFRRFKETHTHFAVILDEYGGTEGIITMEDILEEIVGEIWDETDDIEAPYVERDDGTYIVDGKMNLDDFFDLFDIDKDEIEDTEYVTIGGFCVELLDDRFAKVGDIIHFKNLVMRVIAVDRKNTIEKLEIKTFPKEEDD
jgi:CBS domain containing-hemolysin-like protein